MKLDGWWLTVGVIALAGGALLFFNENRQIPDDETIVGDVVTAPKADRASACGALDGEVDARFDRCLSEIGPVKLSSRAKDLLKDIADDGKLLVLADQLPIEGQQIQLSALPEAKAALLGTEEGAAAKLLRDKGVRGIAVHRDFTAAVDRDKTVIARLAHHDFLEWFQLRQVTPELMIYTVRAEPARVRDETGTLLVKALRARLEGKPVPKQSWKPSGVRLIGSIRLQGQTLALRHEVGNDIEDVLDDLADKLRRRWERDIEILGMGRIEDRLDEARIEVQVVLERAHVEPRSRYQIFDLWELGVDGAMLVQGEGKDQRFGYMPGSEAVAHSFKSADQFLQYAAKEHGWRDRRPWEKPGDVELDLIRTEHFMEKQIGGGDVVRMERGMPMVSMAELTDENVRQMLVDGGEWWLRNMHEDGSFVYKYWPEQNRFSSEYNEVRHILATRDLADTWRYRNDPRYLDGAREAMDWLLKYEIEDTDPKHAQLPHPPPGTLLFRYPLEKKGSKEANQKLGTVAVALLGWVEWAKATGSREEDERIRKMARFVQAMADKTGRFEAYLVHRSHSYYGNKNDIVPGEAALALGEVAEYFGENEWIEFFPKFLDYYEPWFRSRAVRKNPYGRWPHATYDNNTRLDLVQFGPWSVMAAKQYYKLTGDERAAAFGLEVADWMIDHYQWTADRTPWPDYVGGYYKIPQELPAMQTFCYSEGTAAAYDIAIQFRPDAKKKYDTSTREALRFLRVMQYDEVDSYMAARPELIHGGIKYAMNENKIRIDYVGHGLSTVSQYLDARAQDPDAHFLLQPLTVGATAPAKSAALPKSTEADDEVETGEEAAE